MKFQHFVLLAFLLLSVALSQVSSQECEVCEKFLGKLAAKMKEEKVEGENNIKVFLRKECKTAKGKDNRFCYYIGATEDAATTMVNEVSRPLSHHMPVDVICKKLKKRDAQICDLKYEKDIDWAKVNLKKMRVKQLRKILDNWGEDCRGCIEKSDFIAKINALKPKYVKSEL